MDFFTNLSRTYSDGLYYIILTPATIVSFFIAALIFVPRMSEFLGDVSIAESLGKLYGRKVQFITGVAGLISAAGFIGVQFKAFGNVFNYFFDVPNTWSIVLAASIVIIYSAFGGIKSITFTDILQFFTFGFAVPLVGFLIWNQINNSGAEYSLVGTFKNPKFDYKQVLDFNNPKFWEVIPLLLYFAVPAMNPDFCQRIAMSKSIDQMKKALLITGILVVIMKLTISWIPFLIYTVNPNLEPNQLLGYVIDHYTYPGLKALMMIGVTAMAMSTADTFLNTASILFANDIYGSIRVGNQNKLQISRMFSLFLGSISIILALSAKDLLQVVLNAQAFYMPVVTVTLIMTIFGFRSSTKSVLISMSTGFLTVVVWKIIGIKADCIVFAMLMSLIFLVGSHYLLKQPGGWIKYKNNNYVAKKGFVTTITKFYKNFDLLELFRKYSPKSELTYMSFGVYCIFYTLTTMYSTQDISANANSKLVLYIYQIMLCTSVIMAMYPIWPPRVKHEIIVQVAWNFLLFYMLVFFSGFFVLISKFYPLQFVVFSINMVIVASLTNWKRAALMMIPGFYLSTLFYKYYVGLNDGLDLSIGSPQYVLIYSLTIIGAAFVIFLRPKEYALALAQEKAEHLASTMGYKDEELQKALKLKNEFIRNVTHEYHAPMTGVISTLDSLIAAYDVLDDDKIKQIIKSVYQSAIRVESFDDNIRDLARLSSNEAELSITQVNLSELVSARLEACTKIYLEKNRQTDYVFVTNIEDELIAQADEYYLTQTLDNLIINAFSYCTKGTIKLELKKKNNLAEFSIIDQGIGIPKEELYDIFGEFTVSSKTRTPAGGRGVGLALCKRVLEMHKGDIRANSKDGETTFTFFLPLVFDDLKQPSAEVMEIAKNLLKNGASMELIAKVTGLRESQIKALQK